MFTAMMFIAQMLSGQAKNTFTALLDTLRDKGSCTAFGSCTYELADGTLSIDSLSNDPGKTGISFRLPDEAKMSVAGGKWAHVANVPPPTCSSVKESPDPILYKTLVMSGTCMMRDVNTGRTVTFTISQWHTRDFSGRHPEGLVLAKGTLNRPTQDAVRIEVNQ